MSGVVAYGLGLAGYPVTFGLGGAPTPFINPLGPYAIYCSRTIQKPWWQGDPAAEAWQVVMGSALDDQADRFEQARAVHFPTIPPGGQYACPSDALSYLAAERGLERVPTETEDRWRFRLRDAWNIWKTSGTQAGHVIMGTWLDLLNLTIVRRHEFSTPPDVGSNYVRAFARAVWFQFDVVIGQPHPWKQKIWGEGNWGEGTWGSTMQPEVVSYLRREIRERKSAHDTATYLHLRFDQGPIWGVGKWGEDGRVWGSGKGVMSIIVGEAEWDRDKLA